MQSKKVMASIGLMLVSLTVPAFVGTQKATAQETTVALCESPSHTLRIYSANGQTYMRAFNRRDGITWMNNTPASVEPNPEGVNYKNLRGEQTVSLFVNTRSNDCSIKIGNNSPETGRLNAFQPPVQETSR